MTCPFFLRLYFRQAGAVEIVQEEIQAIGSLPDLHDGHAPQHPGHHNMIARFYLGHPRTTLSTIPRLRARKHSAARDGQVPVAACQVVWQMPAAATRTSTSSAFGSLSCRIRSGNFPTVRNNCGFDFHVCLRDQSSTTSFVCVPNPTGSC